MFWLPMQLHLCIYSIYKKLLQHVCRFLACQGFFSFFDFTTILGSIQRAEISITLQNLQTNQRAICSSCQVSLVRFLRRGIVLAFWVSVILFCRLCFNCCYLSFYLFIPRIKKHMCCSVCRFLVSRVFCSTITLSAWDFSLQDIWLCLPVSSCIVFATSMGSLLRNYK